MNSAQLSEGQPARDGAAPPMTSVMAHS
ncbi:hypothetical protein MICRO11B_360008 [Micrococcus luteus]|nr:hypothetical protein MICRO11B_360008 [Micrococcus luteus]